MQEDASYTNFMSERRLGILHRAMEKTFVNPQRDYFVSKEYDFRTFQSSLADFVRAFSARDSDKQKITNTLAVEKPLRLHEKSGLAAILRLNNNTDAIENQKVAKLTSDSCNRGDYAADLANKSKLWITNFFETLGRGIIDNPDLMDPQVPLPFHEPSSRFPTIGIRDSRIGIGGANGMNTTMAEAVAHANHMAKFAQGYCIDWVYNNSHGPAIDVLEILTLNFPGFSPNTANLHQKNWTNFNEQNKDRPHAKYLQFGHSQDAIHIRNALEKAPPEIRNRVILCLFGPAVMVPDELCYSVKHYACEGDVVPLGKMAYDSLLGGFVKGMNTAENYENLIWVKKHPDTQSPHDFQNPAFDDIKNEAINSYIMNNGEYK
jgi:hypothetical protein